MPDLIDALAVADIVVTSTGASDFVLTQRRVARRDGARARNARSSSSTSPCRATPIRRSPRSPSVIARRRRRPQIASSTRRLDLRREAIPAASKRSSPSTPSASKHWYQARVAVPVISALTQKAEAIRAAELERLFARCPELDERERMLVTGMSLTIVSKLLHSAIMKIREKATSIAPKRSPAPGARRALRSRTLATLGSR